MLHALNLGRWLPIGQWYVFCVEYILIIYFYDKAKETTYKSKYKQHKYLDLYIFRQHNTNRCDRKTQ